MTLLYLREAEVACADLDQAVTFYGAAFDLEVLERGAEHVLLGVPGAPSGRIRLVPGEGTGAADARVWDLGARLFGIYTRDIESTARAITAAGGVSQPRVSYPYGERTMTEMVGYGMDGVWWTIPLALPGAHRPSAALAGDPQRIHSELHTAVLVVDDHDAAAAFFTAGGMTTVFDGGMEGEDIERLVGLPSGAKLRLTFLSGPDHLPARMELMSFTGADTTDRSADPLGIQRLVFVCDDVDTTRQALLGAGAEELPDGALRGPAGSVLQLVAQEVQ